MRGLAIAGASTSIAIFGSDGEICAGAIKWSNDYATDWAGPFGLLNRAFI